MKIKALEEKFTVCKIQDVSGVDFTRPFVFLAKTDWELSLVCETEHVPPDVTHAEPGWRAFRVDQALDFGLVGIIAGITKVLAEAGISVFVVSTYDTDYVLLKEKDFEVGFERVSDASYE